MYIWTREKLSLEKKSKEDICVASLPIPDKGVYIKHAEISFATFPPIFCISNLVKSGKSNAFCTNVITRKLQAEKVIK